jgi:hypothetical protein
MHMGRCQTCDFGVHFRMLPSRAGFTLVDSDQALGIGEYGRPLCPNGHGELVIADERQSAEDAITQVAAQVAETPRLPFPAPPFNYEGALHEIFEKQKTVAILEAKFNDADERRKKAKGALDEGHAELSVLIETLQEREQDRLHEIARRTAADAEHPQGTNLVLCVWEEQHPGETCIVCREGLPTTPRDSTAHLDEVFEALELEQLQPTVDALDDVQISVTLDTVRAWTPDERNAVMTWAEAVVTDRDEQASGIDVVEVAVPERPSVLGRGHVAGPGRDSADQACTQCDVVLIAGGDDANYYEIGTLVGTDCKGKPKKAGPDHHYPAKGKAKGKKGQTPTVDAEGVPTDLALKADF